MLIALADTLNTHRALLVLSDPASAAEDEVYAELHRGFAGAAMMLGKVADQMASQRELAMGEHDTSQWGEAQLEAFTRFVSAQSRLLGLLRVAAERDEKMLASMQRERS
jgi:hypothetical protein